MIRRRQLTHAGLLLPFVAGTALSALDARAFSESLSQSSLQHSPQSTRQKPRRKILLDTDIGSDIDDAVALAYLLRQPRCDLLGVTTVTGDAEGRAQLVAALCKTAGVDVPIFPGQDTPLFVESMQTKAPQTRRLKSRQAEFPRDSAIGFLRDSIRKNPHEVTLLAVGPLTNIAKLFALDPEIPALLAELVVMGGKYSDYPTPWGPTEWNIIVDPHAARQVLSAAVPQITATGLDITWQVSMSPAQVAERFKDDPLLETVLDWSSVWFDERELLHFHDPLTAATLFNPDLCQFEVGDIRVDLESEPTPGVTSFVRNSKSNTRVATSVDPEAFFKEYFGMFQT
ncbi:nucleoside hydrolase [Congregibacter brevis]|uniref:Nucleoside hydrolase n=1 Tax=Congregibacter brevis TaxID=3081201 RepID=A0ABZ0IDZ9_9GAMM|nr:nucleoside hydrolase [Congregibacter sp. IMCC45268]